MNLPDKHSHTGGWLAAILSAIGAAVFLLWQPVSDYFVTHTYDDNVVLQIDADSLKTNEEVSLLAIRIRVSNRGSVPVQLSTSDKDDLTLEVRRIEKVETGQWVDSHAQPVLAKKSVFGPTSKGITVYPNAYWAKELAIALPKGAYLIQARLTKPDGTTSEEEIAFELGK